MHTIPAEKKAFRHWNVGGLGNFIPLLLTKGTAPFTFFSCSGYPSTFEPCAYHRIFRSHSSSSNAFSIPKGATTQCTSQSPACLSRACSHSACTDERWKGSWSMCDWHASRQKERQWQWYRRWWHLGVYETCMLIRSYPGTRGANEAPGRHEKWGFCPVAWNSGQGWWKTTCGRPEGHGSRSCWYSSKVTSTWRGRLTSIRRQKQYLSLKRPKSLMHQW